MNGNVENVQTRKLNETENDKAIKRETSTECYPPTFKMEDESQNVDNLKLHFSIPEKSSEHKKRAHSDSTLYGLNYPNDGYLVNSMVERVPAIPNVPSSREQNLGYNFCKWVSNPSRTNRCEKAPNLKMKSTPYKCLKLAGMPPGSPKKSPKDYWLLKHNSTHDFTDKTDVFTFEESNTSSSLQAHKRTLSTILDNSPESEESSEGLSLAAPDVKLNREMQCLKHKKYLQNKYQQQSSSSMESDDVFLETTEVSILKEFREDFKMDYNLSDSNDRRMDANEKKDSSLKSDDRVAITIFTFPPQNKFYRDPCLSESESGLLSPVAMSSIASSPGVVSSIGTYDNSSPITLGLEKFVFGSDPSRNNSGEIFRDFSSHNGARESNGKIINPQKSMASSEIHSKSCMKSLRDVIYDHTAKDSVFSPNACKYFTSSFNNGDDCKEPMKNEDGSQVSYFAQSHQTTNCCSLFPLSGLQSSRLRDVVKSKPSLVNVASSSDLPSFRASAADPLKDVSLGDGSRNHVCQICDRVFSRSDMLSRHMRLHTGQRPYECRTCGQVFSRSDHLQTHLRTHTGEKPYRCSQCLYAAPRRDMVTRHMRVHARGKTRKGKKGMLDVESPPPSPFHSYIIIDEKYFGRSKPTDVCQRETPAINLFSSGGEIPIVKPVTHSKVVGDQGNIDIMKFSTLKLVGQNSFDASMQLPSVDITVSKCPRSCTDKQECHLPLDLSMQLPPSDHIKTTQQHLNSHLFSQENIDWKKLSKAQIEKKKSRKWSLADISSVKSAHITEDRHTSLSAACSPMTRSDSTMSVDSGVSYATPSSLIHSICSPGQISSDSPEVFTPNHGGNSGESTIFLWPTVVHGSPGLIMMDNKMPQHDSIFCP